MSLGINTKPSRELVVPSRGRVPNAGICQVRYETFCTNPIAELRRIANHCELPWSEQFERAAQAFHVRNENHKWKSDLTDEQCAILEEVLEPYLVKYGYESSQELAAPRSQCASA